MNNRISDIKKFMGRHVEWSGPWGMGRQHILVLTDAAAAKLQGLPMEARGLELDSLQRGLMDGAYCSCCGMTAADIGKWPSAACKSQPAVVSARKLDKKVVTTNSSSSRDDTDI
jgi:hypothetical protein